MSSAASRIEQQFDEAMNDTQELLNKKVSAKTKKTAKNVAKKAEALAGSVEHIWEEVENITNSIFPSRSWSTSSFDAQYTSKVSRLFIFRFLWGIIQWPIMFVWTIWIFIIAVVHWISMFLLWKRTKSLRKKQVRYARHLINWKSYMNGLTDARPEIITPAV